MSLSASGLYLPLPLRLDGDAFGWLVWPLTTLRCTVKQILSLERPPFVPLSAPLGLVFHLQSTGVRAFPVHYRQSTNAKFASPSISETNSWQISPDFLWRVYPCMIFKNFSLNLSPSLYSERQSGSQNWVTSYRAIVSLLKDATSWQAFTSSIYQFASATKENWIF